MQSKTYSRIITRLLAAALIISVCLVPNYALAMDIFVFDSNPEQHLEIPPELIDSVQDAHGAIMALEGIFRSITAEQRTNPDTIDALTLLTETLIRRSAIIEMDSDQPLTVGLVRQQASETRLTLRTVELLAESYNIPFLREIRGGVTFSFMGNASASFESGLTAVGIQQITLTTPFAALTVDIPETTEPVELFLGRYPEIELTDPLQLIMRYWSIAASTLVTLFWLIAMLIAKKRIPWWIPAILSVAVLSINFAAQGFTLSETGTVTPDDSMIMITLDGVEAALLSIPTTEPRPNEFVVVDADGNPTASKYNNVTNTIDTRIYSGGVYAMRLASVYFTDLSDKSDETRQAVYMLTSRGLMATPGDNTFLPDRAISRAEFLHVVLNFLNLLDDNAISPFTDVLPGDWYYAVAASAYQEGVIQGFPGGEFRGNSTMTKEQMVVIAANSLIRAMDYKSVSDVSMLEGLYIDADQIARWGESGVALASAAGIVPQRADGLFSPNGHMTREDAAVMLYRLFMRLW